MEDIIKKCCGCHNFKKLSEFNKCKTGQFGHHNHCRSCQKEYRATWHQKNKAKEHQYKISDKVRTRLNYQSRLKYQNDPIWREKRLKLSRELRRTDEARAQAAIQRKAWRSIPHNNIAETQRNRIRNAMKGRAKSASTEKLLGCSYETLKKYIESKWLTGMSWENYTHTGWHIDHIKPCDSFDLTNPKHQEICFHYTNLQPLWAHDNLSKGNKRGMDRYNSTHSFDSHH